MPNKKNRIVGGQETQVNQYPWMAKLFYRGRFYCAGSLINSKYVLTAAHCLHGIPIQYVDSCLIYTRGRAACAGRNFTGARAVAAGWGTTSQGGAVSPVLREVEVPVMSNDECRRTGYGARRITDNMLCAGYPEGRKDSCQGDSGGPLHVPMDKLMCIAGVVSWGDGCARPNYPGVYTRVNRYLSWLKAHTIDACPCSPPGGAAPAPAPAPGAYPGASTAPPHAYPPTPAPVTENTGERHRHRLFG
ncbi:Trypsin-7 [Gryllus bimaculatus]|nr:Trypsin-7 [Gryllus bimaculatus]